MNPETMLREVLRAAEARAEGLLKVERDYSSALRQIIEKGFRPVEAPVLPAALVDALGAP